MDKIIVIHEDGLVDKIGKVNDGEYHSQVLLNYAKEQHPDDLMFKNLNYRHTPELISFFFLDGYNDAIFFNTTKNVEKHGYTGILMLPDFLNEPQRKYIIDFLEEVKDYDLSIMYDLNLDDGLLDGEEVLSEKKHNHVSDLNDCFKKKNYTREINP